MHGSSAPLAAFLLEILGHSIYNCSVHLASQLLEHQVHLFVLLDQFVPTLARCMPQLCHTLLKVLYLSLSLYLCPQLSNAHVEIGRVCLVLKSVVQVI
jgi:hypothetical protein